MIKSRTVFSDADMAKAKQLSQALNLPLAIALLLLRQGVQDEKTAETFFRPTFKDLNDPFLLLNMDLAVKRIMEAVDQTQQIAVFCDYDVDGTSACSILFHYFKKMGVDIKCYTPDRNNDGYGINVSAVKTMVDEGNNLVITVDCGITNIAEVRMLTDAGVDVIVTDHHECGESLPDTPWILNPKQPNCKYPYKFLSGAGIAFKLTQALCGKDAMAFVDFAALGTIADIVPLTGENRIIAKLGLKKMNEDIAPGLKMLRPYVLLDGKTIDEYHIGFGFGPRINAAGRMASAHLALDVMLAQSETIEAKRAAEKLNALNDDRKEICDGIVLQAMEQVIKQNMVSTRGAIFVIGDWEPGVVGICASKLTQRFGRPVLVFAKKGDEAICSARSIEAINIYDVLNNFNEYYIKFGGHHMAAGLTIKTSDFEMLRKKVNEHLQSQYAQHVFVPSIMYDIDVQGDLTDELSMGVRMLAPYGQQNPKPKLLFRDRAVREKNYFGKTVKAHFKFNLNESGKPLSAIKFYFEKKDDAVVRADVVGSITISDFSGRAEVFVDYMESTDIDEYLKMPLFAYQRTLDNLVALQNDVKIDEKSVKTSDFTDYIKTATERSKFGTALGVDDICQYQLLATNKVIKALVAKGALLVKMANDYHLPLNAIVFSKKRYLTTKPYTQIITMSLDAKVDDKHKQFVLAELIKLYQQRAKRFYVDKANMGSVFSWLKQSADVKKRFRTIEDLHANLAQKTDLHFEQAVSGIAILQSLDLIEFDKSDNIIVKLITHKDKKELKDAAIYAALQQLK